MPTLESIPADQRAVLQMILQRGLGYDEIAALLGIDRAAVRQRALDGFDALAGTANIPALQRSLITDYLLGQLPPRVADELHDRLTSEPIEREWAFAIGDALGEAASGLAPVHDEEEHGVEERRATGEPEGEDFEWQAPGAAGAAMAESSPAPGPAHESGAEPHDHPALEGSYGRHTGDHWGESVGTWGPPPPALSPADPLTTSRTWRILRVALVPVALIVAVVVFALTVGGGKKPVPAPFQPKTQSAPAPPPKPTVLDLRSPTGVTGRGGVASLLRRHGATRLVVEARGVPANNAHNAYAIWLHDRQAGTSRRLGYVSARVGRSRRFTFTDRRLPRGAGAYDQILVTLETAPDPKRPGPVILSGPFRAAGQSS